MGLHATIIQLSPLIYEGEQRWVASDSDPPFEKSWLPPGPTIIFFGFLILTVFLVQNDVKRLTVLRHNFQLMPSQVSNFERVLREELKCEKRFSKPHLVAKICHSEYHEISKNSNKMAENRNFTAQELFNQLSFTKLIIFSHLGSSLWDLLKVLVCYAISRKLMTSFSHQKRLKSKIQKQTIVGNAKFYYRAKFQLKQLKIEKLVWKRSLFDDSWPGV